jgi:hypothetical protein
MPITPGLEQLVTMKEHYPNFKCTCFTPAFCSLVWKKQLSVDKVKDWFRMLKQYPWIEIAPHGFVHAKGECMTNRKDAIKMIDIIETVFKESETPFVKVFKAPHWQMSKEFEQVLYERGYTIAIDRNNPVSHTDAPKYIWNWSTDEPISDYPIIKAHGHMYETNNGLDTCLSNLLKIPTDVIFQTVGEYLNEKPQ